MSVKKTIAGCFIYIGKHYLKQSLPSTGICCSAYPGGGQIHKTHRDNTPVTPVYYLSLSSERTNASSFLIPCMARALSIRHKTG